MKNCSLKHYLHFHLILWQRKKIIFRYNLGAPLTYFFFEIFLVSWQHFITCILKTILVSYLEFLEWCSIPKFVVCSRSVFLLCDTYKVSKYQLVFLSSYLRQGLPGSYIFITFLLFWLWLEWNIIPNLLHNDGLMTRSLQKSEILYTVLLRGRHTDIKNWVAIFIN